MPTVTHVGNPSNSYTSPAIKLDEFLPIIRYKHISDITLYDLENLEIAKTDEKVELSEYLDDNKRSYNAILFTATASKFKIPFTIKKGSNDTWDDDGFIKPILRDESNNEINKNDVTILSDGKQIIEEGIFTKYDNEIELEIEIKTKENITFYIDFEANDDEDFWNGEYKNVHCGRLKIVFNYCVCEDWATVSPIIPSDKFIGWEHPGVTRNCYHYSLEQLRQVGHWVKTERWNKKWDGTKELNDHIYQLFLESNVAGMTSGVQKNQFKKGVEYLKKTIKNNIPVMVGVDDDTKLSNDDLTTEHFVVIVGMGTDRIGNYFLFYDNAVPNSSVGTHPDNKLYCKCKEFKLEGKGSLLNRYIQMNTSKKKYIVTQIRETR